MDDLLFYVLLIVVVCGLTFLIIVGVNQAMRPDGIYRDDVGAIEYHRVDGYDFYPMTIQGHDYWRTSSSTSLSHRGDCQVCKRKSEIR